MEPEQQQQRHVAEEEFIKSLNELEDILQQVAIEDEGMPKLDTASTTYDQVSESSSAATNMVAFEEAVADIEQYLQEKSKKH
jgi:hypothetical protein